MTTAPIEFHIGGKCVAGADATVEEDPRYPGRALVRAKASVDLMTLAPEPPVGGGEQAGGIVYVNGHIVLIDAPAESHPLQNAVMVLCRATLALEAVLIVDEPSLATVMSHATFGTHALGALLDMLPRCANDCDAPATRVQTDPRVVLCDLCMRMVFPEGDPMALPDLPYTPVVRAIEARLAAPKSWPQAPPSGASQ